MSPAGMTNLDEPNEPETIMVETLSDCGRIVETIRDRGPVIMDLRAIEAADAQRVRDYAIGAAFVLRAEASSLGVGVYLVAGQDLPPEQERQLRHRYAS